MILTIKKIKISITFDAVSISRNYGYLSLLSVYVDLLTPFQKIQLNKVFSISILGLTIRIMKFS